MWPVTFVSSAVAGLLVAVVAGFLAGLDMPIPATGGDTGGQTSVGFALVAIIASLHAGLHLPIATTREFTGVNAVIGVAFIAVIAGFAVVQQPVAAA